MFHVIFVHRGQSSSNSRGKDNENLSVKKTFSVFSDVEGQNRVRIIFEVPIWMRKDDVKRYVKVSYRKDTFYHFLVYLCDVFTSIIIEIYINDDKSV